MAEIGILGGSGFYELLDDADEHVVHTPYGPASDAVVTGTFHGREVAFLPRHGRGHRIPPHRINYRANLWALKETGITRLISPCAVGSLQSDVPPGTLVVLDQVVDRTDSRVDTYFDGPQVMHVSLADPYCPELREEANATLTDLAIDRRDTGTLVVVDGPRFSTRAESRWFSSLGWTVIGMTQYPEVSLARELELCFLGIALVTDFDAGLEDDPGVEPVSSQAVMEVFAANLGNLKHALADLLPRIPQSRGCRCGSALADAAVH